MMDPKSVTDMISYINNTSKSTFLLLEDLLLWSKSQLGRLSFNPQTVLFTDLWNDISESLSLLALKKGISFNLNIECNSSFYCDKDMIKTVLRNLVTNAIKFSHESSHIDINVYCSQNRTTVEVKDFGVGIEPSRIDSIWQIGGKNSTPGTNNESGSGLGLVICKEFIDLHNGQIRAESTLNQGSLFSFTLPKKESD
jgi:signal transduction histidine kinase